MRYEGNDGEITKRKRACMEKKNYRSERPSFDAGGFHCNEGCSKVQCGCECSSKGCKKERETKT